MAILLKTTSVRVSSIQIMQVRVQNKRKAREKVDTLEMYHPAPVTSSSPSSRHRANKTLPRPQLDQEYEGRHQAERV